MESIGQILLSQGVPAGLSALVVAVVIAIDRYLRYRSETFGAKTSGENREREILSSDQHTFRAAILEQLKVMQEQVSELQEALAKAQKDLLAYERRYFLLEAHIKALYPDVKLPPGLEGPLSRDFND